jgi:hypothetical protein
VTLSGALLLPRSTAAAIVTLCTANGKTIYSAVIPASQTRVQLPAAYGPAPVVLTVKQGAKSWQKLLLK